MVRCRWCVLELGDDRTEHWGLADTFDSFASRYYIAQLASALKERGRFKGQSAKDFDVDFWINDGLLGNLTLSSTMSGSRVVRRA